MPVPAQNSCLREFVSNSGGEYILPHLESSFEECFHQLFGLVEDLAKDDMVLMYSVSMLPKGEKLEQFLVRCAERKLGLAFVLENIKEQAPFARTLQELDCYSLAELQCSDLDWEREISLL